MATYSFDILLVGYLVCLLAYGSCACRALYVGMALHLSNILDDDVHITSHES